jgi:hypothetical protein
MFLADWFEDFHEWHLCFDQEKSLRVRLWDLKGGYSFLDEAQIRGLFREIAAILTMYYDTTGFRQIYPWHHAAGDFVMHPGDPPEVRLTTVRRYEPIMSFPGGENDYFISAAYLLLNLSVRMRLDRLDGTGKAVWGGAFSVEAAVEGFFKALRIMEQETRVRPGMAEELLTVLRSMNKDEISRLYGPLLDIYSGEDPEDFELISSHLEEHAEDLMRAIEMILLLSHPAKPL